MGAIILSRVVWHDKLKLRNIMAQVKIYGNKSFLEVSKIRLSDLIHECIVEILKFPRYNTKNHRFFNLESSDFIYPVEKSEKYIFIEILMMSGREGETKKLLIKELFKRISENLHISTGNIQFAF
jgi:Tautomerase enzyme